MGVPPRSRGSAVARARSSYAARRLLLPAQKFLHTETSSGIVLLAAAVLALAWANSPWSGTYERFWNTAASLHVGGWSIAHSFREWINDALMVVFFFVIGLEVKREFVHGNLSSWRSAALPVVCAVGGMLVPAALYSALNAGGAGARGWGIPMATDIAFALGVLALVGDRVPASLRIFLLALATADDIGAILVIAVFYTEQISPIAIAVALVLVATMVGMQRIGVQSLLYYAPFAVLFWFAVLESGIHATIAGVVLGAITRTSPNTSNRAFDETAGRLVGDIRTAVARNEMERVDAMLGEVEELAIATEPPADRLLRVLHPWSSYIVLPIFALANAGVSLSADMARQALSASVTRGVIAGLVIGKLAGIMLFAHLAVRMRIASLLEGVRWQHMAGVGLLGGIGFTVSLFITDLAFAAPGTTTEAKLGVVAASIMSGLAGYAVLRSAAVEPARTLE